MSVVLTPALPASVTTSTNAARVVNPLATSVAATFEDSYYRRVPYSAVTSVAKRARLVLSVHETGLNVWRVLDIPSSSMVVDGMDNSTDPESRVGWESVLEMEFSVHTNLIASALSNDGRWLVASDLYETKLFELVKTVSTLRIIMVEMVFRCLHLFCQLAGDVKARRVRVLTSVLESHLPAPASEGPRSTGGNTFIFTPDSTKMIMASATTSFIIIIDLSTEEPAILRRFDQHRRTSSISGGRIVRGMGRAQSQDAEENEGEEMMMTLDSDGPPPSIRRMAVSPDGQWLATSDDLCRTFVFNLDSIKVC